MKRVCRAYSAGRSLRSAKCHWEWWQNSGLTMWTFCKTTIKGDWHLECQKAMKHMYYSDCRSLTDHPAERSSEEGPRQTLGHRAGGFAPGNLGRRRTDSSEVQSVRRWSRLDWHRPTVGRLPHEVDATWLSCQGTRCERHGWTVIDVWGINSCIWNLGIYPRWLLPPGNSDRNRLLVCGAYEPQKQFFSFVDLHWTPHQ